MKEFIVRLEGERDAKTFREALALLRFKGEVRVEEREVDRDEGYMRFAKHPQQHLMVQEVEAFEAMHEQLKQTHLELYVAVHGREVVDQDENEMALLQRIRSAYPHEVIMIDQVREKLRPDLRNRSFRLEPI